MFESWSVFLETLSLRGICGRKFRKFGNQKPEYLCIPYIESSHSLERYFADDKLDLDRSLVSYTLEPRQQQQHIETGHQRQLYGNHLLQIQKDAITETSYQRHDVLVKLQSSEDRDVDIEYCCFVRLHAGLIARIIIFNDLCRSVDDCPSLTILSTSNGSLD